MAGTWQGATSCQLCLSTRSRQCCLFQPFRPFRPFQPCNLSQGSEDFMRFPLLICCLSLENHGSFSESASAFRPLDKAMGNMSLWAIVRGPPVGGTENMNSSKPGCEESAKTATNNTNPPMAVQILALNLLQICFDASIFNNL